MIHTSEDGRVCTRCNSLPAKIQGSGFLYLWVPVDHTINKLIIAFKKLKLIHQYLPSEKCLKMNLDESNRERFGELIKKQLSPKELRETQALWIDEQREPQFRDFSQVTSLENFVGLTQAEWLIDLLDTERLTSYFQPIVCARNPDQIFAQEALLRGFDEQGELIPPGRIFSQAEAAGLVFQLDLLARQSAIRQAHLHQLQVPLFINFSPTSVYDPATCLRMTVQAIDEVGIPHKNIVFEVMESEQPPDIAHLIRILEFYREAGFSIALDDFGTGYSNLDLIDQLRPDFIKLDMHLIRNVHLDPYKALVTEKLLEIAQVLNIRTIAEGIECQEELEWVRDRNATYIQGFLIAKPTTPPLKELHLASVS
ncbi:EAL domain-containing protein [Desertifilum sp. FACHB-1129]|uniref:Diguanylate phosphodiesterase n=1 Tax=Desertifilum tharense IPPAS B-1220 TaxID=1781255 RepID=A0A1E5QKY8_9CYAN|nr:MULTISPECIES: EAL domain-containing protein [Desertifilum]MDA0211777.1 EAL domain-containing protein [Cyanobacteria bacterium FC1]MBD2312006.1 EAL domain-containing protein [Desertifilum sp. FACHB-1129]MBD2322459.1 EAL domain-containing protein [Desertifilum sp. FACHB-866]MBD2332622.1 EAL domain-containing protein [Desertifilum sp. FACHB-868]OEJ75300.1 diguanylate phosphodiesterase [Desertifilum tharense IPPAS B-1220]